MEWITPTEDDILTRLSAPELAAFRGVALADGQADPIARMISTVVDYMRGYIEQGNRFAWESQAGGTIPKAGLHVFLDLIVPVIEKRPVGAVIDVSGIRLDARKDSVNWLKWAAERPVVNLQAVSKPTYSPAKRRTRNNPYE
jgi:hypothetical protein